MISSEFPTQINKNTLVLTGSFFNIKNCYFIMDLFSDKLFNKSLHSFKAAFYLSCVCIC